MFNAPHCVHCAMEENLLPHQISLVQCQTAMALEGRECANPAEHHQFVPQFRWAWRLNFIPGKAGALKFYLAGEAEAGLALVNENTFLVEYQDHTYEGSPQKDGGDESDEDSLVQIVNCTLEDWLFQRADWSSISTQELRKSNRLFGSFIADWPPIPE
jgi:hypothetical protein